MTRLSSYLTAAVLFSNPAPSLAQQSPKQDLFELHFFGDTPLRGEFAALSMTILCRPMGVFSQAHALLHDELPTGKPRMPFLDWVQPGVNTSALRAPAFPGKLEMTVETAEVQARRQMAEAHIVELGRKTCGENSL